jgi:hypothetical protein
MRAAIRDARADFLRGLRRLGRRVRLAVLLRRLVAGSLAGLAAGFAYLAVRPFLPPVVTLFHPLVVPGLLLAAGGLSGAAFGFTVRIRRTALAVEADRALGSRGAVSAALELAEGRRTSAFAGPLLADAASALRAAGPRRVLGPPRLPLLPWALLALAFVAAAGLLPFTLRDLFSARGPADREIAQLAGALEDSGRRLEEQARREDLREGLEISRELQQLGQDLSMQEVPAEEMSRRLSEMERRLGAQYELALQRFREEQQPAGTAGEGAPAQGGGGAEAGPGSTRPDEGTQGLGEADSTAVPLDAQELAQALDLLQQLKDRSASRATPGTGSGDAGQAGGSGDEGQGADTGTAGGETSGANEGQTTASSQAGTQPVTDQPGPATDIVKTAPGKPLKADQAVGEGDMARMLVRALPQPGGVATAEEKALGEYRRQAESALSAEQVPLALREYVKGYFTGIGVMR